MCQNTTPFFRSMITASKLDIINSISIKDEALGMFSLPGLKVQQTLNLTDIISNVRGILRLQLYKSSNQNTRRSARVSYSGVPGSSPPSSEVMDKQSYTPYSPYKLPWRARRQVRHLTLPASISAGPVEILLVHRRSFPRVFQAKWQYLLVS